ncbi:sensor histidine kinase N-terminal domain-containing protein [Dechloromonas sp. XY25]|uniref:histidine kinase n=1 Tax=Dechloromonas hankyongensis TaxID=2908002 RepID=A0ABS9K2R0_9RHOO|nr:sensor histidine kinase [Dechloromonas hankyongensis]MCG2577468.1 sensor histidine kinase N-terminal domain-containing protein [Dechloromonas hankyongensis]
MPAPNTTSLRLMLINRLLPAMLALLLLGALAAYVVALRAATKAYDRGLLDTAFTIAEQLRVVDGKLQLPLSQQARAVLLTDKFDRIFYAVHSTGGELLDGNPELPTPQYETWLQLGDEGRWYYDGVLDNVPVRLAAYQRRLGEQSVTVIAGETLVKRQELVRDILLGMMLPEILLVVVAGSVIWFGVRSGLRPLDYLRGELADRSQADLRPVTADVPEEMQPVVTEINGLLRRLEQALSSQRNFVSDAAHQLRTPIAALLAQVEAAQHEAGRSENGALRGIHAAAGRLGHLVEQLLALARAEPSLAQTSTVVSLVDLVRNVAESWLPKAIGKDIDLGFELSPALVVGNEVLLQELLANLLDNALRHTPVGGIVTVHCRSADGKAWLGVEDSGPGIPENERQRVGERFYRPAGQIGDGCGLGLAIVREIARQHHGELHIGTSEKLGGALLQVELPARTVGAAG